MKQEPRRIYYVCPECEASYKRTADGKLPEHTHRRRPDFAPRPCAGSGTEGE